MHKIIFWKTGKPTKHSLTLHKSDPAPFVRELKSGGWRVLVLNNKAETVTA